jgi:hypothetical protein
MGILRFVVVQVAGAKIKAKMDRKERNGCSLQFAQQIGYGSSVLTPIFFSNRKLVLGGASARIATPC